MDEWVCAAAIAPRVVLTEAEVTDPDTILWVDDLSLGDKMAIFAATTPVTPITPTRARRPCST